MRPSSGRSSVWPRRLKNGILAEHSSLQPPFASQPSTGTYPGFGPLATEATGRHCEPTIANASDAMIQKRLRVSAQEIFRDFCALL